MDLSGSYNFAQIFGFLIVSIGVIALGIQSIMKIWKSGSTESSLLTLMHVELERMSGQNSTLSGEIGKLQVELIKLSSQLTKLTIENQKLQEEVATLNQETTRLHRIMVKQTAEVADALKAN